MSDSHQALGEASDGAPPRSGWAILLSTLGLLMLAGFGFAVMQRSDPARSLADVLGGEIEAPGEDAWPFGLQPLSVQKLRDGRLVALLGKPDDLPPLDEMGAVGGGGSNEGAGGGGRDWRSRRFGGGGMSGKFNPNSSWIQLPPGEVGHDPWQVAIVRYPKSQAESVLDRQFARVSFQDLSQISEQGGETALDNGYVVWGGYRLPFVRTRHFRKEDGKPVFHDSIRVNMTRGQTAIVLYARWKPGAMGQIEPVEAILDRLKLVAQ